MYKFRICRATVNQHFFLFWPREDITYQISNRPICCQAVYMYFNVLKRHSLRASDNLRTHSDTAKNRFCLIHTVDYFRSIKHEFGPKTSILISGCHGNENTYFWLFSGRNL